MKVEHDDVTGEESRAPTPTIHRESYIKQYGAFV